jgi:hypothetical protein
MAVRMTVVGAVTIYSMPAKKTRPDEWVSSSPVL